MVYFFLTLLIFSSMEVVSKPLMGAVDPFVLTFWRFFAGSLFFILYPGLKKRFKEVKSFGKSQWMSVFLLGILNTFLSMSFLQVAVKMSSASTAATIFCSNPGFVFIFSVMLGYEKIKIKKIVGFIVGIAGIVIIMKERGLETGTGMIYAVLASVFFALYTLLSKKTVSGITPATVNMTAFPFGIIANGIFIAFLGKEFIPSIEMFQNGDKILSFLYLGFIVTGFGYISFFETIKRFTAVSASLIFMFKPAVAAIMAYIFLNEKAGIPFFAGLAAICIGTFFIVYDKIKPIK